MFVNPLMLAGLGGAVVPLVLHLLNRARLREVEWGAMMFLPSTDHRQRRAVRLRQLALLTLRMAAVGLLAVALARPVIGARRAGSSIGSDGRTRMVLVLDCSASMGYTTNGRARFDAAKRAALSVLQDLHPGDEAALLRVGIDDAPVADTPSSSSTALTTDLRSLTDRVADASVATARSDFATALTNALRLLGTPNDSPGASRQVVVVTDRQASSWKDVNESFGSAFRQAEASLVVVPVGGDESENLSIESIRLPGAHSTLIHDVPDVLLVTVRNFGGVARANVSVVVTSGGREYGRQDVSLAAGASAVVRVPVRFAAIGSHVLSARVAPSAAGAAPAGLVVDDRLDFAFDVADPIRVLVLDGRRSPNMPDDYVDVREASGVLRAALMPHATAGEADRADPARVEVIGVNGTPWPAIDRRRCDVLGLVGIARPDARQLGRVYQFVFDGGGVLIVPERATFADAHDATRATWTTADGASLLPARLRPVDPTATRGRLERFGSPDLSHPAFAFLGGEDRQMPAVEFVRHFATEPVPGARVLLHSASSSSEPVLIECALGRGHVILVNAELTPGVANPLPRSNLLLPLLQSLTRWLARDSNGTSSRNLLPGEPIEMILPDAAGERATIVLPDGSREQIDLARRPAPPGAGAQQSPAPVNFARTRAAGRYEVRYRAIAQASGPERAVHLVVRLPPEESDLTPLTEAQWAAMGERLGLTRLSAADLDAGRRGPLVFERRPRASSATELWAGLIGAVGGLLLIEGWLSRRWSGVGA